MKKMFGILLILLVSIVAFAQDIPSGIESGMAPESLRQIMSGGFWSRDSDNTIMQFNVTERPNNQAIIFYQFYFHSTEGLQRFTEVTNVKNVDTVVRDLTQKYGEPFLKTDGDEWAIANNFVIGDIRIPSSGYKWVYFVNRLPRGVFFINVTEERDQNVSLVIIHYLFLGYTVWGDEDRFLQRRADSR
jgi:hypothetical protein